MSNTLGWLPAAPAKAGFEPLAPPAEEAEAVGGLDPANLLICEAAARPLCRAFADRGCVQAGDSLLEFSSANTVDVDEKVRKKLTGVGVDRACSDLAMEQAERNAWRFMINGWCNQGVLRPDCRQKCKSLPAKFCTRGIFLTKQLHNQSSKHHVFLSRL